MSDTTKSVDEINIIVRRIINDTKTGVIDLLDDNGRGGLYHAIEDLTQLFTKQLQEAKDINDGHWYMDDRYNAPYIAHCSCGYASGSTDVIKGHVAWKLATLTQDTKGGTDDTPRVR